MNTGREEMADILFKLGLITEDQKQEVIDFGVLKKENN